MSRLFLGNFDFESGLARPGRVLSRAERRRNLELSFAWLSIAEPGDAILDDELPPPEFIDALPALNREGVSFVTRPGDVPRTIVPWGWNVDIMRWAVRERVPADSPPLAVVAEANARDFSFQLESAQGIGLDGQSPAESLGEVRRVIAQLDRWLIKARFGASGRERIRGQGPTLTGDAERWIEQRLDTDGVVFVEPLVVPVDEAGLQWELPRDPLLPPQLMGVTRLRSDARGQFAASEFSADGQFERDYSDAVELTRPVAEFLQQRGYFGPLGIDAMRYRDAEGRLKLRPLQDINARWTMGRLSLGWKPLLQPGESGLLGLQELPGGAPFNCRLRASLTPAQIAGQRANHLFQLQIGRW